MTTRIGWRQRGACLQADPELFFPIGTTGAAYQRLEQAKDVCAGCPVRDACLNFAVTHSIEHGVWGGLGEEERRAAERRPVRTRTRIR